MKRTIIAVSLILVLLAAGVAFAHSGMWNGRYGSRGCAGSTYMNYSGGNGYGPGMMGRSYEDEGRSMHRKDSSKGFSRNSQGYRNNDMPDEISSIISDMHKTSLEMRREMLEDDPDIDLLRDLHGKMMDMRNKISGWNFDQKLDDLIKDKNDSSKDQ